MQFVATLLICAIPFFLLFGLACHYWNERREGMAGPVGYAVVVVVATLLWQGAWDMTGGVG